MNKEEFIIDEKIYENYEGSKIKIVFSNLGRRYKKIGEHLYPDLPRSLINNKNIAEKEIMLGVSKIKIEFEVKEEMQKADIILGVKWLEQVKPYHL